MIRAMQQEDWGHVLSIYTQGIHTNLATFTAVPPDYETWNAGHMASCRLICEREGRVMGFAALIPHIGAPAYDGVAEVSVYVDERARHMGVGRELLLALISASEQAGIWTLESVITADNSPSVQMHEKLGFRLVGRRERISYTPDGIWHDTLIYERRSPSVRAEEPYISRFIRPATLSELPALQRMYADARAFMRQSGNQNQWTNGYPTDEQLIRDISQGALMVCMDAGSRAAVFAMCGYEKTYDEILGAWQYDEDYHTVHRIAVARRGAGIASYCIQWALMQGKNVRADTHRDNLPMQRTLLGNGFQYCGIIHLEDGSERLAYEAKKKE